jgi:hypothetical protein
MILTHAALVSLAAACVSPPSIPLVVGIAEHESGGNTLAVNHNKNGTDDVGLGQINTSNLGILSTLFGRTVTSEILKTDPCLNLRAAEAILLVRYNGRPPIEAGVKYVQSVTARIRAIDSPAPPTRQPTTPDRGPVIIRAGHGHALTFPQEE